jgi:transposase
VFVQHYDGIHRSRLGERERIGSATVESWFEDFLQREIAERSGARCPRILGIDEHLFSRKQGYATTFCDLRAHRIFDVVLGRSEAALDEYLSKLPGKQRVRVICMDLSSAYRALVRKHFPKAKIVADRFHVIRLIHHHFLACWRDIDPRGAKNRGFVVYGDCDDVAIHSQQRHHRGFPQQNEMISRQAFGFRNFENHRIRVKVLCG